ncbi:type 2 lanthipeptide synthetase LanM family protein [Virgibacillus sp. YIM 98842]|uniref:type 2 lanthipeptide synthetase LanM family protein n=1 Tax=Virgibacillus sp. YIM 98842 TaxID=2663533 RepID=UPI0013DB35C3|nr:type 2 lanthipeptide synthetase LanM family protein [Virgibacillus sp. YIM 98842]
MITKEEYIKQQLDKAKYNLETESLNNIIYNKDDEPVLSFNGEQNDLEWINSYYDIILYNSHTISDDEVQKICKNDFEKQVSPFFIPFLTYAYKLYSRGKTAIRRSEKFLDEENLPYSILSNIYQKLLNLSIKTLVQELQVSKIAGELKGETKEDRYSYYFTRFLSHPEHRIEILNNYPVLTRILVEETKKGVQEHFKVIRRLDSDFEEIEQLFKKDFSRLKSVESDMGDTHQQGQSVMILNFSSGEKLVYKPRSLATDLHFNQLLNWVNEKNYPFQIKTIKVLNKQKYGWQEFVNHQECSTYAEIKQFYTRLGGLIAILYILEATDFHLENIIASGADPFLVDMESIFQNSFDTETSKSAIAKTVEELNNSVFRTGVLPIKFSANSLDPEYSGVGGEEQELQLENYVLDSIGTDNMRMVLKKVPFGGKENRPFIDKNYAEPENYSDEIISGFQNMYSLFILNKDELISESGPIYWFKNDSVRFIPRATQTYATFQYSSYHPKYLMKGEDRVRLFNILADSSKRASNYKQIVRFEIRDLLENDIPYFTSKVNSQNLYDSRGHEISNFFKTTSLEKVLKKIRQLNENDCKKQSLFLKKSLATLDKESIQSDGAILPAAKYTNSIGKDDYLEEAVKIGESLIQSAIYGTTNTNNDVSWIGIGANQNEKLYLSPLGTGLYDGVLGVGLFLAFLAEESGNPDFKDVSKACIETSRTILKSGSEEKSLSAFYGYSSVAYVLAHLSKLWNDNSLMDEAADVLKQIKPFIHRDTVYDLMGGSAGALIVCLKLYEKLNDPELLNLAILCGDHLLKHAKEIHGGLGWHSNFNESPLAGLSHGCTGIAWALIALSYQTGINKYQKAGFAALKYEDSLFNNKENNWKDLRSTSDINSVNWCHGAAGIGIGRLQIYNLLKSNHIKSAIHISLKTTLQRGFGHNNCLCHGDLGNLELISLCNRYQEFNYVNPEFNRLSRSILKQIQVKGYLTGIPKKIETPGFMLGNAGIGYGLLRIYNPSLPSILSLEL